MLGEGLSECGELKLWRRMRAAPSLACRFCKHSFIVAARLQGFHPRARNLRPHTHTHTQKRMAAKLRKVSYSMSEADDCNELLIAYWNKATMN